jgi:hypothetical protein
LALLNKNTVMEKLRKGIDMTNDDFVYALKQRISFTESGELVIKGDISIYASDPDELPLDVDPDWIREGTDASFE